MKARVFACASVLLVPGCFAPNSGSAGGDIGDAMPDDLPAGGCRGTSGGTEECETEAAPDPSTTGGSTGAPVEEDRCDSVEDCNGSQACAAAWDPDTQSRGPLECQFACVPTLDERTWCIDDASCCEAAATCSARGYCIVEGAVTTSTGAPDTGSSTDAGGTETGGG